MPSFFVNGGIIGSTLDYGANNSNDRYIVGTTPSVDTLVYVGGQTSAVTGTTTSATVTFNLTGGVATTPAANDLVIVAYAVSTNNSINPPVDITSGYTVISSNLVTDTQSTDMLVSYKVMGSVPDTSFTRSQTGNTSHAGALVVHVWRNANITSPFSATATTASITNTAVPDPPAITPATTNSVILVAASAAHLAGTQTFTAGYLSNFRSVGSNDDVDATIGMGSVAWTSGSYNPAAWTFGGTDSTQYSTASTTMAIRPRDVSVPVFGNLKNSGIWNLESQYEYQRSQYTPPGDMLWTGAGGTTYWKVPPGVTNVAACVIGAGGGGSGGDGGRVATNGGGGGGGCAWGNFIVTPGEILTIVVGQVGAGGTLNNSGSAGGASSISRGATVLLSGGGGGGGIERNAGTASGGTSTGTARNGGGAGGNGGTGSAASGGTGGGGAGGVTGTGGNGGAYNANGSAGTGLSGGGGAGTGTSTAGVYAGAGGGSVPYGTDLGFTFGNGGTLNSGDGQGGGGGSPGNLGQGGVYGGGGGGLDDSSGPGLDGGQGVVRIMWGSGRLTRSFPSSNTGIIGVDIFV